MLATDQPTTTSEPPPRSQTGALFAVSAALAFVTLLGFLPVVHARFINYDDQEYVTENPSVLAGLATTLLKLGRLDEAIAE